MREAGLGGAPETAGNGARGERERSANSPLGPAGGRASDPTDHTVPVASADGFGRGKTVGGLRSLAVPLKTNV